MLLSVSIIIHLNLIFINFIAFSYSQVNTIGKVCGDSSVCSAEQACVNGECECDPARRRFWSGNTRHCRVCPDDYIRLRNRCYKYFSTAKNHSEARADCRKSQADLFSWRDNTDENELLTASTRDWGYNYQVVRHQFYAWSGGIVNHGRNTKADYKITWFDPKGPTIPFPDFDDPLTERYCDGIRISNYKGDREPTRLTKNGETENCVSFVFLPQPNARGHICIADDFCSTKMSYICELTEATLSGVYQPLPSINTATKPSGVRPEDNDGSMDDEPDYGDSGGPSALAENDGSSLSNKMIYVIGGIIVLVIIGAVAFVILRKRSQNQTMNVSPTNSMASSNVSGADMYANA